MKMLSVAAPDTSWRSPPEALVLGREEVHVWRASLDHTPLQIEILRRSLAADEEARAGRFHFEKDRAHFVAARGVLRDILGCYLKREPECLSFRYGSHGKPALAGYLDGEGIRFSVSHSHGMALYAVAREREVGVDLERVRPDLAVGEIAERFFSRWEVATLRALPAELQRQAFFRCWTRKEAYIKARGEGLSLPLEQFDVSLAPGKPAALLGTRPDPSEASRWSLQELCPVHGYVAALAVEAHGWRLSRLRWPGDPMRRSR